MNKLILGLVLGIVISTPLLAIGKIAINPIETVNIGHNYDGKNKIFTTKITVEEGTYRIFIFTGYHKGGITAIKIK